MVHSTVNNAGGRKPPQRDLFREADNLINRISENIGKLNQLPEEPEPKYLGKVNVVNYPWPVDILFRTEDTLKNKFDSDDKREYQFTMNQVIKLDKLSKKEMATGRYGRKITTFWKKIARRRGFKWETVFMLPNRFPTTFLATPLN